MTRIRLITILAALGIGMYLAMSSVYTVSEVEQAIVTEFGRPVGDPVTTAGLKVKVPFIQDVNLIDKRVLEWDGSPSDMPARRTQCSIPPRRYPGQRDPQRCRQA